jgi:hypothetical protein
MSDTDTTTTPTTYVNADGDPFAALGTDVKVRSVNNSTVDIPDNVRKLIASEVTHFSGLPNTEKRELTFPTEERANKYRMQLKSYAREHNLNCYMPATLKDGTEANTNGRVTYRLAPHTERSAVDTKTVTVTAAADLKIPAPAKPSAPKPSAPKPSK